MVKNHHPRRGSLQFWPRKRARRLYARIRNWIDNGEIKLQGFIGYKVGMTHILIKDQNPNSPTKNMGISIPVTVVECPPLKPLSIRFYKKTSYGLKLASELFAQKLDKELSRKTKVKSKGKETEDFDEIRLAIYTQPRLTTISKKKPEIIEIAIGGKDSKAKLEYARQLLEKDIDINDIFKEGQLLDVHGVTKGQGFQGTVKIHGAKIRQHKSEKTKRGIGNLGAWKPKKVQYTIAQAGKHGYKQRTEYNKLLMKIGENPGEINPNGGWIRYGLVKNRYILIKGSVPGTEKRPIILTEPKRASPKFKLQVPQISYISTESKQR